MEPVSAPTPWRTRSNAQVSIIITRPLGEGNKEPGNVSSTVFHPHQKSKMLRAAETLGHTLKPPPRGHTLKPPSTSPSGGHTLKHPSTSPPRGHTLKPPSRRPEAPLYTPLWGPHPAAPFYSPL
ncbi:unnamed protein product [Boreogadus saida]